MKMIRLDKNQVNYAAGITHTGDFGMDFYDNNNQHLIGFEIDAKKAIQLAWCILEHMEVDIGGENQ